MKVRIPDLVLILALIAGGFLAWSTGRVRSRLEAEHRRLARSTGDLRIGDPSKIHVLALGTGEPLHFAWRVYAPAHSNLRVGTSAGHSSSSTTVEPREFIARVRIREDDEGLLNVYDQFSGGSSRGVLGDKALADLVRGRWDEIVVEQIGADGQATIDPDGSAVLLRLKLPEVLQAEARSMKHPSQSARCVPVLFEFRLGPPPPPAKLSP